MQVNNLLNQQGTGTDVQQIKFVPKSSNVSYLGTTVTYGIDNNTYVPGGSTYGLTGNTYGTTGTSQINAFNNVTASSGNWSITPNVGFTNIPVTSVTPSVSASQFGQLGSGMINTNLYNTQVTRGIMVQPTIDISETSSDIVVSAYVSNSIINDLNLNVTEDSVTMSGTLLTGNNLCVLNRTVPLSTSVRAEAVDATLQSGVLEIRLPKTEKFHRNKATVGKDVNQK